MTWLVSSWRSDLELICVNGQNQLRDPHPITDTEEVHRPIPVSPPGAGAAGQRVDPDCPVAAAPGHRGTSADVSPATPTGEGLPRFRLRTASPAPVTPGTNR